MHTREHLLPFLTPLAVTGRREKGGPGEFPHSFPSTADDGASHAFGTRGRRCGNWHKNQWCSHRGAACGSWLFLDKTPCDQSALDGRSKEVPWRRKRRLEVLPCSKHNIQLHQNVESLSSDQPLGRPAGKTQGAA